MLFRRYVSVLVPFQLDPRDLVVQPNLVEPLLCLVEFVGVRALARSTEPRPRFEVDPLKIFKNPSEHVALGAVHGKTIA